MTARDDQRAADSTIRRARRAAGGPDAAQRPDRHADPDGGADRARSYPPGRPPRPAAKRPRADAQRPQGLRLQRVLAAAGVAARRVCEQLIAQGRVSVNGQVVTTLPIFVDPASDRVEVDGQPLPRADKPNTLPRERHLYILVHKPERVLGAGHDGTDRKSVLDLVDHPRVALDGRRGVRLFPVGRLDFHTSGLMLLTSDGTVANRLTHPRYRVEKVYRAVIKADLDDAFLRDLERGLQLKHARAREEAGRPGHRGGVDLAIEPLRRDAGRTELRIAFRQGGDRPIGDMLREAGLPVMKVSRIGLGPLTLSGVGAGHWRELTRDEVRAVLRAGRPNTDADLGANSPQTRPQHRDPAPRRRRPALGSRP